MTQTFLTRLALLSTLAITAASGATLSGVQVTLPIDNIGRSALETQAIPNGVKLFGYAQPDCDMNTICTLEFSFDVSNSLSSSVQFDYHFQILPGDGLAAPDWTIRNDLGQNMVTGSGQDFYTGSINLPTGTWTFHAWAPNDFTLIIPPSSWDFTPGAQNSPVAAPEPSSLAILGIGLCGILFVRRYTAG